MPFRIRRDEVSNRSWGDVDKTALRNRLVRGLEEGVEGVRDAIREVYAVIRSDDLADAPSQNWWGPHHEVRDNGDVVLNVNGLVAAAQALAGARAEPDLTPEQRRAAARHLLRHYRELDREPPASLLELAGERPSGEMVRVVADIAGEIRPSDIPLAPWVNLEAITAGDDDPLEVVVRIPEGRSRRGWYYTRRVLERIAAEINSTGLPGLLGHQDPDRVDREFVPPVTHWVGAVVRDEGGRAALYARGVIDKAAGDLKRWLRGNVIRQVSIYGVPTLATAAGGETHVVDFHPLSIDWTPLNRAGMPTSVVAVGEMDVIIGPTGPSGGGEPMGIKELLAKLREMGAQPSVVIGEMGWSPAEVVKATGASLADVAKAVAADQWAALEAAQKAIGEMANLFGLPEGATVEQVLDAVKAAHKAQADAAKAAHDATLDKVVGEMVTAEAARPLVRRLVAPTVEVGAGEDAIRKAVGEVLQQEDVRQALAGLFREPVIAPPQAGTKADTSGLIARRVSI